MIGTLYSSISNDGFLSQLQCQLCKTIYTWHNMPYILLCNHTVCRRCISRFFSMPRTSGRNYVEIICLYCIQSNSPPCRYSHRNIDFRGFLDANFLVDYALLAYIYKNYQDLVIGSELGDPNSIFIGSDKKQESPMELPMELPVFNDIKIVYEEDKKFFDDKEAKEESKARKPEDIFLFLIPVGEYLCYGCKRVFNKRNVPFEMKCGHTICEVCVASMVAMLPRENRILFRCTCHALSTCIKPIKVPKQYAIKWIARKVLTIGKKLLTDIYKYRSIDAKKAAWEFSLKRHPRSCEIEERFCCQGCKSDFIETIPYLIPCGHNICLSCAYKELSREGIIRCTIDGLSAKSEQVINNPAELGNKMQVNTMLKEYMRDNYKNKDEEYPVDPKDDCSECPVCSIPFDNNTRKEQVMCKSKHTVCEPCLIQTFAFAMRNINNGRISILCVTCRFSVEMMAMDGKEPKDYLKPFIAIISK